MRIGRAILPIVVLLSWLCALSWAHPPVPSAALVKVWPDGRVTITIIHDALAFAVNDTSESVTDEMMLALLNAPDDELEAACVDGRNRIGVGVWLMDNAGTRLPLAIVESPTPAAIRAWQDGREAPSFPCTMDFGLESHLPDGTQAISIRLPEILAVCVVVVDRPQQEPVQLVLMPREVSPLVPVRLERPVASEPDQRAAIGFPDAAPIKEPSRLSSFLRFVALGFTHIIPAGVDHVLFVLALFLLSPRLMGRDGVFLQIFAFTLAHTITLTLASLNLVRMPASIVEPAIALSIAAVAIENVCLKKPSRGRLAIAFVFGLVHGLGVATAFHEAVPAYGSLVLPLLGFTLGVEGGHLLTLLLAFALLGWTRSTPWYRSRVVRPLSLAIGTCGLVWIVQRLL